MSRETTLDLRIMNLSTHWMDVCDVTIIATCQTSTRACSVWPAGASHTTYRHQTHEMHIRHLAEPTKYRFPQSLEEQSPHAHSRKIQQIYKHQTPALFWETPPASKSHQEALVLWGSKGSKGFLFEESRGASNKIPVWITELQTSRFWRRAPWPILGLCGWHQTTFTYPPQTKTMLNTSHEVDLIENITLYITLHPHFTICLLLLKNYQQGIARRLFYYWTYSSEYTAKGKERKSSEGMTWYINSDSDLPKSILYQSIM